MKSLKLDIGKRAWLFFAIVNLVVLAFIAYNIYKEKDAISLIIFKALIDIFIFASYGDFRKIAFNRNGIVVEK